MKNNTLIFIACFVMLFSCKRPFYLPSMGGLTAKNKFLIKGIEWKTFATSATLDYNSDGSLQKINYDDRNPSITNYEYDKGKIIGFRNTNSLSGNFYNYNASGELSDLTRKIFDTPAGRAFQMLKFSYNAGLPSKVEYFLINTSGNILQQTNSIDYDLQKRPVKITSVDLKGEKMVTTIEGYSAEVSFDPHYFISNEIGENYSLYNYAILSKLKQLPNLIKVTKFDSNNQPYLDKETSINYSITNEKLIRQVEVVKYPLNPTLDKSSEIWYTY